MFLPSPPTAEAQVRRRTGFGGEGKLDCGKATIGAYLSTGTSTLASCEASMSDDDSELTVNLSIAIPTDPSGYPWPFPNSGTVLHSGLSKRGLSR